MRIFEIETEAADIYFLTTFRFHAISLHFFFADVNTNVDAVNGMMSSLFQLSAYLLLMPLVILASNLLFEELNNDTLKNLVTHKDNPMNRHPLGERSHQALPI